MASICNSSEEYNSASGEFIKKSFVLSDREKDECLNTLHCSKKPKSANSKAETFKTCTSHWVKGNSYSRAAYHLFKVKRWYLTDENLIFDPLLRCDVQRTLTPSQTLWRDFHGEDNHCEGRWTVDNMLTLLTTEQFSILETLDAAMAPLHENYDVRKLLDRDNLVMEMLNSKPNIPDCASMPYTDFVYNIVHAMHLHVKGYKLREVMFEEIFSKFVECVAGCIGGRNNDLRCSRNIFGMAPESMTVPVKKEAKLVVASRPDLYLYKSSDLNNIRVISVTEVKGLVNDDLLSSDDEEEEDATQCQHVSKGKDDEKMDAHGDDDNDDNNKEDVMEVLKGLVLEKPSWLDRISSLPHQAQKSLKKFLPQLMGEMMCCARSKGFHRIDSEHGLLLGIGVAGFDVYFVSMLDSCLDHSKFVVNNDSACTQIFVTRPFNLKNRKDRRTILKIITASLLLGRQNALL